MARVTITARTAAFLCLAAGVTGQQQTEWRPEAAVEVMFLRNSSYSLNVSKTQNIYIRKRFQVLKADRDSRVKHPDVWTDYFMDQARIVQVQGEDVTTYDKVRNPMYFSANKI